MSKPSMTLKRGSANSFFIAALRTCVDTPRATKREKSASGVNAATSARVGRSGAEGVATVGGGSTRTGAASACTTGGGTDTANVGTTGAAGGRDSALRRDHRLKKPSSAAMAIPLAASATAPFAST